MNNWQKVLLRTQFTEEEIQQKKLEIDMGNR